LSGKAVTDHDLVQHALQARNRAYAPYSHFPVGSALLACDGTVHYGCNVENAAYSSGNCAERTALFRAIAEGYAPKSFQALAIVGDTEKPLAPCGVCRQVLVELCAPNMPVIMANLLGDIRCSTVADLLPIAFELPQHVKQEES